MAVFQFKILPFSVALPVKEMRVNGSGCSVAPFSESVTSSPVASLIQTAVVGGTVLVIEVAATLAPGIVGKGSLVWKILSSKYSLFP